MDIVYVKRIQTTWLWPDIERVPCVYFNYVYGFQRSIWGALIWPTLLIWAQCSYVIIYPFQESGGSLILIRLFTLHFNMLRLTVISNRPSTIYQKSTTDLSIHCWKRLCWFLKYVKWCLNKVSAINAKINSDHGWCLNMTLCYHGINKQRTFRAHEYHLADIEWHIV